VAPPLFPASAAKRLGVPHGLSACRQCRFENFWVFPSGGDLPAAGSKIFSSIEVFAGAIRAEESRYPVAKNSRLKTREYERTKYRVPGSLPRRRLRVCCRLIAMKEKSSHIPVSRAVASDPARMNAQAGGDRVSFFLVDVFSGRPLEGNPVAVVPDGSRLAECTMQRIAREFNQSETTFVLPPTRVGADRRLRSFTPAGKEAFGAGHNALGAWWWLAEAGELALGSSGGRFTQEIGNSLLPVDVVCESGHLVSIGMSQGPPEFGKVFGDLPELAAALGLTLSDLAPDRLPVQVVSTGAPHMLVPLRDRSAIDRAHPDFARLASVLRSVDGEGCYLFSLDPVLSDSIAHARFFNPTLGIIEDAATGTAAGPLACQLVAHCIVGDGMTMVIEQGFAMGRPSSIRVHVSGRAVQVSGRCFISGKGELHVGAVDA
jgi:trans-2,3-dihydro-3-hydroxyanthranilate isomerase